MNRISALVLATAVAAVAAAPASASSAGLTVRSVDSARTATPGLPVAVDVVVKPARRARGAKVRFYLSADARRDRGDVRLRGRPPVVPAGQALGDYRLIACLDACRPAKRPLRVTAAPVGTRELVASDVAAGKLTAQQGLVYRVFGAFGDRRLPRAYAGDDAAPEHTVLREVVERWPSLSSAQRARLAPFLTPPAAKRSWASGKASAAQTVRTCASNALAKEHWRSIARSGGHVRIWWRVEDEKRLGSRARSMLSQIENVMWPRLAAVFGRTPLRDGGVKCFHGIDPKLDVYLMNMSRGRAVTVPYPPSCAGTPSFIIFNTALTAPERWEMAHELTHAFQFAYKYRGSCASYAKWDEAVANWGAAHVYPKDDDEHVFRWLLRDPEKSLADASYEGWVFPYAMEQLHGAGTIRAIYEETERLEILQAIDRGIPGGLAKAWPEFARLAWNDNPVSPTFLQWDRFPQRPELSGAPIPTETLYPRVTGEATVDVPLGLEPLSRAYRRFKFDPGTTQITVEKPTYADFTMQALIRTRDGAWRTEDWKSRQPVWCPVDPAKRIEELILVLSNNSLTKRSPGSVPLRVMATTIGCARYRGELTGSTKTVGVGTDIDEHWTAKDLVFERFGAEGFEVPRFLYQVRGGSVTWSLSGHSGGCSVKAGPVTLPVGNHGQLDITAAISNPTWHRGYYAWGGGLPQVQGTATCPTGTQTRWFGPNGYLSTTLGTNYDRPVGPDGVLQGTNTQPEGHTRTSTYSWRLVPEG